MANDVEVKGVDKVVAKMDKLVSPETLTALLGQCCALVERTAKELAPKDNGELRRSITSKVENNVGIVFTPLEYAPYVEFGTGLFAETAGRKDVPWCYQDEEGEWHSTSGQKPQPFLRPALEQNRANIKKLLKGGK